MDHPEISPIADIIEDARDGQPYILVDAPDRENEGDVIIPAQFATPKAINFMARHARGLICLAITAERAQQLDLAPMVTRNQSGHGTAFTVSIEAREGVTTGISAHDRAHTVAVAVDPTKGRTDIVSPGHVFPLIARDGGVLVRAGHTEAAVDISRAAGLFPAGVICEIMNEDGSMARLPELIAFAQEHGLKIGTISDLIQYRRRSETLVERMGEAPFPSHYGDQFRMIVYRNRLDGLEHVALIKGAVRADLPTLVRVHPVHLVMDVLGWSGAPRDYVGSALRQLSDYDGAAVGVFIRDPESGQLAGRIQGEVPLPADAMNQRTYGVGAQILKDLGVGKMILLTGSTRKLAGLDGFGLDVVGRRPVQAPGDAAMRLVR